MNTETQVLDPAVTEPMAIDPNAATPAPTETLDPSVNTPIDPITGNNSNPGSSSNTSNGNQVAVNSNFDYSVHNYTVYSHSSTHNQETLITQIIQTNSDPQLSNAQVSPANSNSQLSESFSCGTSEARLGRSYRFASRQFFRGRRSRVERITNFDAEAGDAMELSRRLFKGIGELDFVTVANRKGSQRAARTDNDIIYEQSTGQLYFNANSSDQGFGSKGGLFAILDSSPLIGDSQFVIF